ncbi:hypothetical protein P691DRAFT_812010, partial [Macrolepiota fuliginosa MF-IS2]
MTTTSKALFIALISTLAFVQVAFALPPPNVGRGYQYRDGGSGGWDFQPGSSVHTNPPPGSRALPTPAAL